jgi:hypothetical protein
MAEADALITEVAGLLPVLEGDLARAAEIADRLRELADAQRQEIVPDAGLLSHKLQIWRVLDLRAHCTADLATNGHSNRDWFEREERGVVSRGRWRLTDYDAALMRFSGEPLSISTLVGPGLGAGGKAARIGVIIACLTPAALIVGTGHGLGIGAAAAPFLITPLRDWLKPLFEEQTVPGPGGVTESCPGIGAYRLLVDRLISVSNEHISSTNPDGVQSGKFAATFADLEITLNQMRRVVPPPLAQRLHDDVIKVPGMYLSISRDWFAGKDVRTTVVEAETLENRANESLAALNARCP